MDVVLNNKVLEADNSTATLLRINRILTRLPMHHQLQNDFEFLSWSHDRENTKKRNIFNFFGRNFLKKKKKIIVWLHCIFLLIVKLLFLFDVNRGNAL